MEVISIGGKAIKINGKLLTASALASPENYPQLNILYMLNREYLRLQIK